MFFEPVSFGMGPQSFLGSPSIFSSGMFMPMTGGSMFAPEVSSSSLPEVSSSSLPEVSSSTSPVSGSVGMMANSLAGVSSQVGSSLGDIVGGQFSFNSPSLENGIFPYRLATSAENVLAPGLTIENGLSEIPWDLMPYQSNEANNSVGDMTTNLGAMYLSGMASTFGTPTDVSNVRNFESPLLGVNNTVTSAMIAGEQAVPNAVSSIFSQSNLSSVFG